jgi:prefoldin subunit 5
MNNANAAAKARRAGIKPTTPVPTAAPAAAPQGSAGLTLPQVISVIDRRLVTLETFMKETKEGSAPMLMQQGEEVEGEGQVEGEDGAGVIVPAEFNAFVDEINNRFQMLASEIETMKNALLKLQTFTMDVNKSLLEKTEVLVPASATDAVVPLPETDPVSVADEAVTADAPVEETSA